MKNNIYLYITTILLIVPFYIFGQSSPSTFRCHIKGEVIDRPESKTLILTKNGEDLRINRIEIPIEDKFFEYQLDCEYEELYELAFEDEFQKGNWRPISFIAEDGEINFSLYPQSKHSSNRIEGGILNDKFVKNNQLADSIFDFSPIEDEFKLLYEQEQYHSEDAMKLIDSINNAESTVLDSLYKILHEEQNKDSFYSKRGLVAQKREKKLEDDRVQWQLDKIRKEVDLVSYGELINILDRRDRSGNKTYRDVCFDIFTNIYKKKYPNHPYTNKMDIEYIVDKQIKVGGKYIDFENPDFEGNNIKISEQIEGKVALIDLWASWCGPCRRNSIAMIPVYEKYKDKGFTIVGIARESEARHGINAAKQDKYPWLNLLEIQDQNQVWSKYGVGNSGGATFLVDKDGTILAINPTLQETEKILEEKTN